MLLYQRTKIQNNRIGCLRKEIGSCDRGTGVIFVTVSIIGKCRIADRVALESVASDEE